MIRSLPPGTFACVLPLMGVRDVIIANLQISINDADSTRLAVALARERTRPLGLLVR
jgi:hypothetical protein